MPKLRGFVLMSSLWIVAALAAGTAQAQSGVGLGIGHSNRFNETLVRGDLVMTVHDWEVVPNFEYVRANDVRRYVTSLDLHYKLPWRFVNGRLCGYLGAGIGVITEDPVGPTHSTTHDGQVNFLGGVLFEGPLVPYVELRSDARKLNYLVGVRLSL